MRKVKSVLPQYLVPPSVCPQLTFASLSAFISVHPLVCQSVGLSLIAFLYSCRHVFVRLKAEEIGKYLAGREIERDQRLTQNNRCFHWT